jgi:hypothetical protein
MTIHSTVTRAESHSHDLQEALSSFVRPVRNVRPRASPAVILPLLILPFNIPPLVTSVTYSTTTLRSRAPLFGSLGSFFALGF